jgi:alanine dehydrogenase
MKVGIPSEVKNNEFRVAITPAGVFEFTRAGHQVFVQSGAGVGSSIGDADYVAAGATILPTADDVWGSADLVLKVKEPIAEEYGRMREGQVLFTYLHLAASKECTDALIDRKVTGIAYETVELPDRSLPLLAPMSEVAGRLAPQVGSCWTSTWPGCARPTPTTAVTSRRSPPTRTRSRRPSSTPTWSSARCWCRGRKRPR